MFTTLIVQPIFNLLVLIYALIPGHNFGLAIIIFTIVIRILMWPLVKKQLHQAKAMRELAPELKKIKAAAGSDRQKASAMTMELYKEREINPFASLGIMLVQLPIFIGLYSSIRRIIGNPHQIVDFSYPALHHLGWMQNLAGNIHHFDNSLVGIVDLGRKAAAGGIYWPALVIVIASATTQYFQARQLMPKSQDSRSLRQILRESGSGKSADQQEVNAAVSRGTQYLIPGIVLLVGLSFAAALSLYLLVNSAVACLQQAKILNADVEELEATSSPSTPNTQPRTKPKSNRKKRPARKRKR